MTLPWLQEATTTSSEGEAVPTFNGRIVAPKHEKPLDFNNIDTRNICYDNRMHLRELPAVVSAKEESEYQKRFDQFCEENIEIGFNDETMAPPGFGIPKQLEAAIEDRRIVSNLKVIKVNELNPLQTKAIKIIRLKKSIIVMAPTGIGKTYAFLLPAIEKALAVRHHIGPHRDKVPSPTVLILSSTGRLATQTYTRCSLILGLQSDEHVEPVTEIKIERLVAEHRFPNEQCDIAFATMGKLRSTITEGGISFHHLKMVVLDEADKMIDDSSFGRDVEWVLEQIPPDILENLQCCFFSATYLSSSDGGILLTPLQETMLASKDYGVLQCPRVPGYITQTVVKIDDPTHNFGTNEWIVKMSKIKELIDADLSATGCTKEGPFKETIIIFCETVHRVGQVTMALRQLGYAFRPISRLIKKDTQEVFLNELASCSINGVVCTNILARGIDVASTIVMEMATEFSTYKHRIGRVGRDGSGGKATVFLSSVNLMDGRAAQVVEELCEFMHENGQDLPGWLIEWYNERQEQYQEMERYLI